MKLPKRFALSSLLLLMLVVASIFGYAQWRRQSMIDEVNALRRKGVYGVTVNDGWFWPEVRQYASVRCFSYSPTAYSSPSFKIQENVVSADEAYRVYSDVADRLVNVGLEKDRIEFQWHHYVSSKHHGKQFTDVATLTRPFFDDLGRE